MDKTYFFDSIGSVSSRVQIMMRLLVEMNPSISLTVKIPSYTNTTGHSSLVIHKLYRNPTKDGLLSSNNNRSLTRCLLSLSDFNDFLKSWKTNFSTDWNIFQHVTWGKTNELECNLEVWISMQTPIFSVCFVHLTIPHAFLITDLAYIIFALFHHHLTFLHW